MAWQSMSTVASGAAVTAAWANTIRNNLLLTPAQLMVKSTDLFYATGSKAMTRLAPSASAGYVVKAGSGALTWGAVAAANVPSGVITPIGGIVMWRGALGAIPSGYQLCNGTNGTPDLRNRFVVGAGSAYSVGATGGAATVTPTHTHAWTVATDGGHEHYVEGILGDKTGTSYRPDSYAPTHYTASDYHHHWFDGYSDTGGALHTHSYSSQTFGAASDNLPQTLALYYIQRLS